MEPSIFVHINRNLYNSQSFACTVERLIVRTEFVTFSSLNDYKCKCHQFVRIYDMVSKF